MSFNRHMIKKQRRELGLTQKELGRLINLKQNTVSQWESGDRVPDNFHVMALAELFNLSLEQFYLSSSPEHTFDALIELIDEREADGNASKTAWYRLLDFTREKYAAKNSQINAEDLRRSLEKIRASSNEPSQFLDLNHIPPSIYRNIVETVTLYLERCARHFAQLESIEKMRTEQDGAAEAGELTLNAETDPSVENTMDDGFGSGYIKMIGVVSEDGNFAAAEDITEQDTYDPEA